MKYMGSKRRLAKELLPIILKDRRPDQWYVEPFVGGGNMIENVTGNRIGADVNQYVVAALDAISKGWVPPQDVSREEYREIKANDFLYPDHLVGFVSVACSFGARFWGGYAKCNRGDNYAAQGSRNAIRQAPKIAGVEFVHSSYNDLTIPDNSIIYCDPPYAGVKGYSFNVDHEVFWQWCRDMSCAGHSVFVSEYTAPEDFTCWWEKEMITTVNRVNNKQASTEKLFEYVDWLV